MKTHSKKGSFLAAVALGVAVLAGSALPSLAQTATALPQTLVQTAQPSTGNSGWYGPTMWWPVSPNTAGAVTVPQTPTAQPAAFWGCWGGWW